MKQIIFLFSSLFILASCHFTHGSGNIITENRTVGDFKGISVGGGFDVEVKIGPVTEVKIEADDNVIQYIKTSISGNILRIRTEDMHNFSDVHMKVYITTPVLTIVKASAAAEVVVNGLLTSNDKLSFEASSGSSIRAEVAAPEVETDASSGANINISGKTRTYSAEASSGADIKTWDLMSENTTVSVSSGANANVHASVNLKTNASSGGEITYHGAANVEKTVSSSGSVKKRD